MAEKSLETSQCADIAIAGAKDPINPVGTGQVEFVFHDGFAFVLKKRLCVFAKNRLDVGVTHENL